MVSLELVCSLT